MRSGELARRAGVNPETLRYYERRGLLPDPDRRPSGHREYPPEALDRVRAIKRAQRLGFTLAEIEQLLGPGGRRPTLDVQTSAAAKLAELDERLVDLRDMQAELRVLVDLDCDALVGCSCERDGCPVAHDERVARAELEPKDAGRVPADRAVQADASPPGRAGRMTAWLAGGVAAAACLACLLPVVGIGAVAGVASEISVSWELFERVGVVVAAVIATSLVMQRRAARGESPCCRCGGAVRSAD